MSDEPPSGAPSLTVLIAAASALKLAFAARLRLARRQAEDRLRLAVVALGIGLLGVMLFAIALVFGLQACAEALLSAGFTPAVALLITAGGTLLASIVAFLIARACARRALNGPKL